MISVIKKLHDKSPILFGVICGEGLFILFIMLEFFLVTAKISNVGVIVDSCIRLVFCFIALMFMRVINENRLSGQFIEKIPKSTWLFCIPFFLYLGLQFLYLPISESLTAEYVPAFLLCCVQQIATGLFEETASKGLVMSGMLSKWKNTVRGRLGMVFVTGVLFGMLHILNVLFTGDISSCLWQAVYSSVFGVFTAAIYSYSENLTLCIVLHAVWDILIRIRGYFCVNVSEGIVADFIYIAQDVLELCFFPIITFLICIKYKPISKRDLV